MMAPSVLLGFDHLDAFVCYLRDTYYTSNPIVSFEIRGVNVTGSPTGKNVMQNVRGQSSMIMVCWFYQTSLLLKRKYTSVSTQSPVKICTQSFNCKLILR